MLVSLAQLNIVCRLGGFHTMMSFLGSLGKLMKGFGFETLLAEVYADNTINIHIISGKVISRALRAHFLVEAALMLLILEDVFDVLTFFYQHTPRHYFPWYWEKDFAG